jgi:hypothetical protein
MRASSRRRTSGVRCFTRGSTRQTTPSRCRRWRANLIDTNAVSVFAAWINSLPGIPALAPPTITPNGGSYIASVNVTLSAPGPECDDLLHAGRLAAHDQFVALFRRVQFVQQAPRSRRMRLKPASTTAWPPAHRSWCSRCCSPRPAFHQPRVPAGLRRRGRQQLCVAGHHQFFDLDAHQHQHGIGQFVQPAGSHGDKFSVSLLPRPATMNQPAGHGRKIRVHPD